MDNSEKENQFEPLDTLRGAFVGVYKIKRNQITISKTSYIKLSEIKLIENDDRYDDLNGSMVKTYKDTAYFCCISQDELLKLINLFIFKPDEYFETYGA